MSENEDVKPDELESQLSAMFDGELPAGECELLSRRIDRDENLRARWSRYAVIGAAMRCEPVATARSDFAGRVSRAVDRAVGRAEGRSETAAEDGVAAAHSQLTRAAAARDPRMQALLWQSALAAALVAAVAGLSILMLRSVALGPVHASAGPALARTANDAPLAAAVQGSADLLARARQAAAILGLAAPTLGAPAVQASTARTAEASPQSNREPWSYVTPPNDTDGNTPLRTELVDYIVAHSEYSSPLTRPDLLSELISGGEDGPEGVTSAPGAVGTPVAAGPAAAAGDLDASPPAASGH